MQHGRDHAIGKWGSRDDRPTFYVNPLLVNGYGITTVETYVDIELVDNQLTAHKGRYGKPAALLRLLSWDDIEGDAGAVE